MADFAEAKAYLSTNVGGNNLYDHLSEVLLKIVSERPEQSLELFEHLSAVVKESKFKPGNGLQGTAFDSAAAAQDAEDALAEFSKKSARLFAVEADEDTNEKVKDMMPDVPAFEWAGAGYGDDDVCLMHRAMVAHAQNADGPGINATSLRFWGKILGTGADYYIMEAEGEFPVEDETVMELVEDLTAKGDLEVTGYNKLSYFVANSIEAGKAEWVKLPNVLAAQVVGASKLRRFFTGDLNAPMKGHPPFPGNKAAPATEASYLRAQIARITAACQLNPVGLKTVTEEGELEDTEEYAAKPATAMGQPSAWLHAHIKINPATGRCVAHPVLDAEGNELDSPPPPPQYPLEAGEFTFQNPVASVASLRSNQWPGAVVVAADGRAPAWTYCGYGQPKLEARSYTPSHPVALMEEYDDSKVATQRDVLEDPTPPEEEGEEP